MKYLKSIHKIPRRKTQTKTEKEHEEAFIDNDRQFFMIDVL